MLAAAPAYGVADDAWLETVRAHFGAATRVEPEAAAERAALMPLARLLDQPLRNREHDRLGRIADLAVELGGARVAWAALALPDEEAGLRAVAWEALAFAHGGVVADLSPESVLDAEALDPASWPVTPDSLLGGPTSES